LANDEKTSPWVLNKLSKEKNVAIRRGVAANKATPVGPLNYMEDWDEDAVVKSLAKKNLRYTRRPGLTEEDLPKRGVGYYKMVPEKPEPSKGK
jgi:hypothetical protein